MAVRRLPSKALAAYYVYACVCVCWALETIPAVAHATDAEEAWEHVAAASDDNAPACAEIKSFEAAPFGLRVLTTLNRRASRIGQEFVSSKKEPNVTAERSTLGRPRKLALTPRPR